MEAWQKLVYAASDAKLEMEETHSFISHRMQDGCVPEDADTGTFPALHHFVKYITSAWQNIFVRTDSECQEHSGHIRTARSLCPSGNHWGFLFSKNRGKVFKSKLVFHIDELKQLSPGHKTWKFYHFHYFLPLLLPLMVAEWKDLKLQLTVLNCPYGMGF